MQIYFMMIWSVVHFAIILGHFGAFFMPLRTHKTNGFFSAIADNFLNLFCTERHIFQGLQIVAYNINIIKKCLAKQIFPVSTLPYKPN
jgi:hypothetical protein